MTEITRKDQKAGVSYNKSQWGEADYFCGFQVRLGEDGKEIRSGIRFVTYETSREDELQRRRNRRDRASVTRWRTYDVPWKPFACHDGGIKVGRERGL